MLENNMTMYVTSKIHGGLGNRLFQIGAMLGYAEKHGHIPVFVKDLIIPNPQQPGGDTILEHFPEIRTIESSAGWVTINFPFEDAMTYRDLPHITGNVKLDGYFQSAKYFPSGAIELMGVYPTIQHNPTLFLHIRRGDYLHPFNHHHCVDLGAYYERALALFPGDAYVLVCSDDIEWCKATLPSRYPSVGSNKWIWFTGDTYATLSAMMGCTLGGICANSTFSWWGAYLSRSLEKLFTMPDTWTYNRPGFPLGVDIYPPWVERVPV